MTIFLEVVQAQSPPSGGARGLPVGLKTGAGGWLDGIPGGVAGGAVPVLIYALTKVGVALWSHWKPMIRWAATSFNFGVAVLAFWQDVWLLGLISLLWIAVPVLGYYPGLILAGLPSPILRIQLAVLRFVSFNIVNKDSFEPLRVIVGLAIN